MKRIKNAKKPGKTYGNITIRAESVVKKHLKAMIAELCTLENVEYFDFSDDDDGSGVSCCEYNDDTEFRECFLATVEAEIETLTRKHMQWSRKNR